MIDTNIKKSSPLILNEAKNYIDGLMLGDGHISCNYNNTTGRYQHNCKHREWVNVISKYLNIYGIECTVDNGRFSTGGLNSKHGSVIYSLRTLSYIEFKEMKDRWYKKYYNIDEYTVYYWHIDNISKEYFVWRKVVPKDIILTPECVANWYLGDGSISTNIKNQIVLSTNGFDEEDILFLSELLYEKLNISFNMTKNKRLIISNKTGVIKFLNYIKDFKLSCYSYKFPDESYYIS